MTRGSFKTLLKEVANTRDELERRRLEVKVVNSLPKKVGLICSTFDYNIYNSHECRLAALERSIMGLTTILDCLYHRIVPSFIGEEGCIGGRRVADAIVVSAVVLLTFVYHYLVGYIDRGGSKAGSSGPLDFRDIYISIVLFQAAYVWIKFRDAIPSIPKGALYQKPGSIKWEVRILFPATRRVGGKLQRIPLRSYYSIAEGEIVYRIAAFYCNKPEFTGQLDLGGGAYFPIPALNVDPNLPYKEQVQQVGDQVLNVYAEFVRQKALRTLPPSVPGLALEMPSGEGQLITTSPIQQLQPPLNSGMDSVMQGQGSQQAPNIHNASDFNNPGCFLPLLAKTQHDVIEAYKQIECLKAQVSRTDVENMGWDIKYSKLERKYSELERKYSEVERENGLLNQIMQSQRQTLQEDQGFDTDRYLNMEHEESLTR